MILGRTQHRRRQLFAKAFQSRPPVIPHRRGPEHPKFPWGTTLLWLIFASACGYVILFSPWLKVEEIMIEGESMIPSTEYRSLIEAEINGVFLGAFPRRNFFLLPVKEIETKLLQQYPKLETVQAQRRFPNRLTVQLKETPAILLWCSGGPCYRIQQGRASSAPTAEADRYAAVRFAVIDTSALPVELGVLLPVETYLETFYVLAQKLPALVSGEASHVATTPSRHSGELQIMTGEGWRLLLSVERPAESSLGMLRIFLSEYAKSHPDRTKLTTVDLRIEGKVFYAEAGGITPLIQ